MDTAIKRLDELAETSKTALILPVDRLWQSDQLYHILTNQPKRWTVLSTAVLVADYIHCSVAWIYDEGCVAQTIDTVVSSTVDTGGGGTNMRKSTRH